MSLSLSRARSVDCPAARRDERAPRIAILCPAPNAAMAYRWGDFHFAESLVAAFEKLGARAEICLADSWDALAVRPLGDAPDVTLLLRGVLAAPRMGCAVRLMWMLSHPDRVSSEEMAGYDHVFIASTSHAEKLRPQLQDRVSPLLQCSDPQRFGVVPSQSAVKIPAHSLLFVGNSRRSERWVVLAAVDKGHTPAIYGAEWENTPLEAYVWGETIPNRELGHWYAKAQIVLNDHWPDMARNGFISNRLFDVAMAGAFPISDRIQGAEVFCGNLVQVGTPDELDQAIRHYRADPAARQALAAGLQRSVVSQHTFDNRAAEILQLLRTLL